MSCHISYFTQVLTSVPVYTAKLPSQFTPFLAPRTSAIKSHDPPKIEMSDPSPTTVDHPPPVYSQTANPAVTTRSSIPPSPTSSFPGISRSIGQALAGSSTGEDSPVMNETLSVIDEHITDLSTPRQSLAPPRLLSEDSESDYSSHLDPTSYSYIAGPETDSEDNPPLTEAQVKQWDAKETAEHLRSIGVDSKHCDIFQEQEITGDVLLEMDQSFLNMKDYDFGLMGRRLKTWHKIREFQAEVRSASGSRKASLKQQNTSTEDVTRMHSRALSSTTILPRIPSLMEEPGLSIRPPAPYVHLSGDPPMSPSSFSRSNLETNTPPSPWRASMAAESPGRPSAASIRELSHSRRHSSIEAVKAVHHDLHSATSSSLASHKKNASFDRDWSMSNATTANTGASTPSLRLNTGTKRESLDLATNQPLDSDHPTIELDRGYFSGNEVDNRKVRNLLKKRESMGSPSHSRQSSMIDEPSKPVTGRRHSRLSSVDSIRDRNSTALSPAAKAYHSRTYKGRFRSASARSLNLQKSPIAPSPAVTNLEDDSLSSLSSPKFNSGAPSPAALSAVPWTTSQKARKLLGLRAASEAVTGSEKEAIGGSPITSEPLRESPTASTAGSQTPSITSKSIDVDSTDTLSKGTGDQLAAAGPLLHTKTAVRTKPKTKQQTSAYRRGLLHLSPAEARQHCDHHGWMKKKSAGLMASWKPRLFILRGRRLSYYYSENDTEEQGIIDISGHKVLVANSDPIITIHATITGASLSPSVGAGDSPEKIYPNTPRTSGAGAPFYFKLVPPKAGASRAVQFTRPTVYYFQVDNINEGRKWMGEIMKATIEHDLSSFETTNRQTTISLAKARARKERPPALKGTEDLSELATEQSTPGEEKSQQESGLNIQGLNFEDSKIDLELDTNRLSGLTPVVEDGDAKVATT